MSDSDRRNVCMVVSLMGLAFLMFDDAKQVQNLIVVGMSLIALAAS